MDSTSFPIEMRKIFRKDKMENTADFVEWLYNMSSATFLNFVDELVFFRYEYPSEARMWVVVYNRTFGSVIRQDHWFDGSLNQTDRIPNLK